MCGEPLIGARLPVGPYELATTFDFLHQSRLFLPLLPIYPTPLLFIYQFLCFGLSLFFTASGGQVFFSGPSRFQLETRRKASTGSHFRIGRMKSTDHSIFNEQSNTQDEQKTKKPRESHLPPSCECWRQGTSAFQATALFSRREIPFNFFFSSLY